jgi:5-methylthioadenosine/S-adenosylhomocysteine deaminase
MKAVNLIISASWVCPVDAEDKVYADHSVVIHAGEILEILPREKALAEYQPEQHYDLPGQVILPGLVNAHAHSPMVLLRGLGDDKQLMDWLKQNIWPAEKSLVNPAFVRDGTELAMAEMLLSGTTCFAEHYFFPEVTVEVCSKVGMRVNVGLWSGEVETPWAKDVHACMQRGLSVFERYKDEDAKITFSLAPHSPYMIQDDGILRTIAALSHQHSLPVHMHVCEPQEEEKLSMQRHGKRSLQRLADVGLLNEYLIAVHMTQAHQDDLDLFIDSGASMVHCPASNLKLASGFAAVQKLQQAGVNLAIGTDGAASNNSIDMFQELRLAALLAKGVSGDPTALNARRALRMATLGSAKALHLDHCVGSLEPGKQADIIAVDLSDISMQPAHDPYVQLVYAMASAQVSHVWVAGRPLVLQRKLQTLDMDVLRKKAARWSHLTLAHADHFKKADSSDSSTDFRGQ